MKLTKYQHACFTVEKDGQALVVDPGNISDDFSVPDNVVAIVITHEHADHFDPDVLATIYNKNPDSLLLADQTIIDQMPDHNSKAVQPGDKLQIGAFVLEFFGGTHAEIHSSMPRIANLGVLVNETLYYPGDALTVPKRPIDTLALPVAAPWVKISEVIDFLVAAQPRLAFPTHDAILSAAGHAVVDGMLNTIADSQSITYQRLDAPIDL